MTVQFSGWEVLSEKRRVLRSGQAPRRSRAYTMYHGTHRANASAIITGGFRPSAGGTLGPGVYCSRDIAKATGYPAFCSAGDRVVLQLRVRVGRVKRMDGQGTALTGGTWQQSGYNTAWLPPRAGGHEEDCVADPQRVEVTGIAHCSDAATRATLEQLIRQQGRAGGGSGGGKGGRVGSAGKCGVSGVGGCKRCGHKVEDGHSQELCWVCGSTICPFMDRHVCHSSS